MQLEPVISIYPTRAISLLDISLFALANYCICAEFNLEKVTYKDMQFFAWDIGGQAQLVRNETVLPRGRNVSPSSTHVSLSFSPLNPQRAQWRHYCANTVVLVYVVDSSDVDRIEESRKELHKLLAKPELKDTLLLVLANQQDRPASLSVSDITERLGLNSLTDRTWSEC